VPVVKSKRPLLGESDLGEGMGRSRYARVTTRQKVARLGGADEGKTSESEVRQPALCAAAAAVENIEQTVGVVLSSGERERRGRRDFGGKEKGGGKARRDIYV
jgi:predicted methyltransferase MtxX (methanogen marker protein 4)